MNLIEVVQGGAATGRLHAFNTVEHMAMPIAPTPADIIKEALKRQGLSTDNKEPVRVRGKDKKGGRAKSRTLSVEQFEALRPFLDSLSADRVEAARLAMVESGQQIKLIDIAARFGWKSRQSVDRAVTAVWDVFQKQQESQKIAQELQSKQPSGQ